jgi:hypothetical protein
MKEFGPKSSGSMGRQEFPPSFGLGAGVGFQMRDFDRVRKAGNLLEIHSDDQPGFGPAGSRQVRPQLQEEQRRMPGRGQVASDFSQAAHFLDEPHKFIFGSHDLKFHKCYRSSCARQVPGKSAANFENGGLVGSSSIFPFHWPQTGAGRAGLTAPASVHTDVQYAVTARNVTIRL